jgi:hypothetical protein
MYAWSSINNTKKADETIYLRRVIGRFSLSARSCNRCEGGCPVAEV